MTDEPKTDEPKVEVSDDTLLVTLKIPTRKPCLVCNTDDHGCVLWSPGDVICGLELVRST